MSQPEFRTVNPMLGMQPSFGPIPADQIVPWCLIAGTSYLIGQGIFSLDWLWVGLMAGWGISTWWIITGGKSWRFLAKFQAVPRWTRGFARYQRMTGR
ncbi:hypothetical protein [Anthocerotibacter panamensis]|uniref:hypothetical protein n=1 Tax=Anthocerotibacter panamensis TaxID=2857077 RepID=UPI001C403859|nr:hypothetical protein [Anthocerotibacter panamensis]